MSTHYFSMPEAARCTACGGVARVELDVGPSGYSVGSGHEHTVECPTTKCPHGIPWSRWGDECLDCEREEHELAATVEDFG